MSLHRVIRVALPVPVRQGFDYLCAIDDTPPLGGRVRVPFSRSERIGIVIGHPPDSDVPRHQIRPILERLDVERLIEPELLDLLCWSAAYYLHPIGEVVSHALPGPLRKGRMPAPQREQMWALSAAGKAESIEAVASRAPRQAQALRLLAERQACPKEALAEHGIGASVLRRLREKGLIETTSGPPSCAGPERRANREQWPRLTAYQRAAVESVEEAAPGFGAFLLYGVTGSGKTEVYLRLIARALQAQRQALLLVPEIGLTPQLVRRLEARFGKRLAVLHSALGERERLDAWRQAHDGGAELVVGTRSAIFASLPRLGLIIVDEEHDTSFKQQTGFRYSARDLGVVRAQKLGIKVVLGSATPSLESFYNARTGRYRLIEMPERIGSAGKPSFRLVDLNVHASRQSLSTPLSHSITRHLSNGNQVILFLNRRGFAPALFCSGCGETAGCEQCDAAMTVHAKIGRLRCHHCGRERALRWSCPRCGTERIAVGAGTQRVSDELQALLPDCEIARLDRDATSTKGSLHRLLDDVTTGRTNVLVGTQMLTKGHDFTNVTLVGVLNADQGLFGTDFRSEERLAQTIVQVAGRAGRGDQRGEVVIQTHHPRHRLLQCLIEQGYTSFASLALREREAAAWPPYTHIAAVRAEARSRDAVFEFLRAAKRTASNARTNVTLLGPAASALERRSGRYRAQLLLKSTSRAALHAVLGTVDDAIRENPASRRVRWSIDVDPIEI
jgi:primosomal protein N' (replication factor Y)